MNKIERLEKYISDFFSTRWQDIVWFWQTTHRDRQHGVYQLKRGNEIMDLLFGIKGTIGDNLIEIPLIPQRFATPAALFTFLNSFKSYLERHQELLDINMIGEDTGYEITHTQEIKDELIQMIDHCKMIYDQENTRVPYDDLRYSLITKNVAEFIKLLSSILATVSYAITKTKEGYYHSNVHLILRLLGFDIISEEQTNVGRIDAVIRFVDVIYILEFKFDDRQDKSAEALDQIITSNYADKFYIEKADVIGIGISFATKSRNINGYKEQILIKALNN